MQFSIVNSSLANLPVFAMTPVLASVGYSMTIILGLALAMAVFWFVVWTALRKRRQQAASRVAKRGQNVERPLFEDLCAAHHLDQSQGRLLQEIARNVEVASAAMLFVDSSWLQTAAQQRDGASELLSRLFPGGDLQSADETTGPVHSIESHEETQPVEALAAV